MSNTPTVVGLTDVGRARSRNEDSMSLLPALGAAVVADGMGGHPGGDVASGIAVDAATRVLSQELGSGSPEQDPPARLRGAMARTVLRAHEHIRERGLSQPELAGMGTTITIFAVDPASDAYAVGHVGDSRAYRFRDGRLTQLTRDDTWVQDRVDEAQLTPGQARRHPYGHLLTQCLGLETPPKAHILEGSVQVGDAYLLCTDGLVGMLEDADIEEILWSNLIGDSSAGAEKAAVEALLAAANDAGGHDNVTVALIVIGS